MTVTAAHAHHEQHQQQQQQHTQQSVVSLHVGVHLLPQSDDERSGQILRRANAPKSTRGPAQQQYALQHQPRIQQDSQTNKTNEHVETPLTPASNKPHPPLSNQSRIPATLNAAAAAQPRSSKVHQVLQGVSVAQPARRVLGLNLVGGERVQQPAATAKTKQVFFRQVKMSSASSYTRHRNSLALFYCSQRRRYRPNCSPPRAPHHQTKSQIC